MYCSMTIYTKQVSIYIIHNMNNMTSLESVLKSINPLTKKNGLFQDHKQITERYLLNPKPFLIP